MYANSIGSLTGVAASGRYGLVVQGQFWPEYDDPSNVFEGTEQVILTDGQLPVPGPPPLPEAPP